MRLVAFAITILMLTVACSTPPPSFETVRHEGQEIAGFSFDVTVSKDTFGSKWKLAEVRPARLPYSGEIAELTAEQRWIEMFKKLKDQIKAECPNGVAAKPRYRAEMLDFRKAARSTQHPQYAQARFICK